MPIENAPDNTPAAIAARGKKRRTNNIIVGVGIFLAIGFAIDAYTPTAPPTQPVRNQATTEPTSQFTRAEENAIRKAESYLNSSAFSRSGLIDQLEYNGFPTADATMAVDHLKVDWNEQAWKKAESYLNSSAFSRSGLIDQLKYNGFTTGQATYGVDKSGL